MEILVKLKWNQSIGIPEETPVISSFYMYGFAVVLDEYFWKKTCQKTLISKIHLVLLIHSLENLVVVHDIRGKYFSETLSLFHSRI